jgi:hypothetical protein
MTAVEFLESRMALGIRGALVKVIDQAKEMEKEQIEDAFCDGVDDEYEHHINNKLRKNSEQYYNETFKNK